MTRGEAVNWLINITADIGKSEHRDLWHYEQALSEIREMLESEPERKKGKWIGYLYPGDEHFECSVCHEPYFEEDLYIGKQDFPNYSPNCGSYNGGGDDD